ncbi:hypothetical protein FG386_001825 [Cryptosporidium ryanae]|uniref:uncharacterized protein n=1 Tax=Cryptosporidium ryanae TaxID=515981 RepID=UPI00351A91DA|nr:hypothetical protein FG386_001825 [Cryptosporidium ryanae]
MHIFNLRLILGIAVLISQVRNLKCKGKFAIELNSIDTITDGLRHTIYIDAENEVSFSLTNSFFEPGPNIYIEKKSLSNSREVKKVFKKMRVILVEFYVNMFGIVLADYLSQVEEIEPMGVDLEGNFKLINRSNFKYKNKMKFLDKKLLKSAVFKGSHIIGVAGEPVNYFRNSGSSLKLINNHQGETERRNIFESLGKKKLHVINSKASGQIAICRCRLDKKRHFMLIQMAQTFLFAIFNTVDSKNSPWYSLPDFIAILLRDLMEVASIMKFLGNLYPYFKNTREYFNYSKKRMTFGRKKYYSHFFGDKKNNYHTKFLLEIFGITLSFIGNVFYSFITDFKRNSEFNNSNLASSIQIEYANNFKRSDSGEKFFSKQDIILINEYINRLPNDNNCVIYSDVKNIKINSPGETKLSLC